MKRHRNGLFYFAQKALPQLLAAVEAGSKHPPTLIVTGATAAVRGSAKFATFAAGKFAQRGITQSLAREFGPRGVHVAYTIIDGGIDTPWGKERLHNGGVPDGKISPESVSLFFILLLEPRGFVNSQCGTQSLTLDLDCRELLVPAHTA